jgi:hypothetical protein
VNTPHLRVWALRDLAHIYDRRRAGGSRSADHLSARPAATFATLVRERLDGPVLGYSRRTDLLCTAQRSGIGRFEANLIIAAVQHEAGERAAAFPVEQRSRSRASWVPIAIAVVATQAAIAFGAWLLIM